MTNVKTKSTIKMARLCDVVEQIAVLEINAKEEIDLELLAMLRKERERIQKELISINS